MWLVATINKKFLALSYFFDMAPILFQKVESLTFQIICGGICHLKWYRWINFMDLAHGLYTFAHECNIFIPKFRSPGKLEPVVHALSRRYTTRGTGLIKFVLLEWNNFVDALSSEVWAPWRCDTRPWLRIVITLLPPWLTMPGLLANSRSPNTRT